MVASKIVSSIIYHELKTIHSEDYGKDSDIYELEVLGTPIAVIIGQPKYEYSTKGVIYMYIYAVYGTDIRAAIGIYECPTAKISSLFVDGELDADELDEPLIFTSFVTPRFIKKMQADPSQYHTPQMTREEVKEAMDDIFSRKDKEDDIFELKLPEKSKLSFEKQQIQETISDGIFKIDQSFRPTYLKEEGKLDADKLKKEYHDSIANSWIEKFMKNNQYRILENEGGGDCLFACIRDAMKSIGKYTTVDKLRALLADQVTDEVFRERRDVYLMFMSEIKETEKEMKIIEDQNKLLKKKATRAVSSEENQTILLEAKRLKEEHTKLKEHLRDTKQLLLETTGDAGEIDSIEKLQAYICTSSYWAEEWAISTLETALNIKIMVMSEDEYRENSMDSVLSCGLADENTAKKGTIQPDHYIIVSLGESHYRLVSYKEKKIFTFKEIPYDIKVLVLNRCLERNAGSYYMIQDFRNMKTRYGIDPEEGAPDVYEYGEGDTYDSDTIFVVGDSSAKATKPGKGSGEKIATSKLQTFVELAKSNDWRKKLDDDWAGNNIVIDKHKWASVRHYLEGAKYKKGFPDIYLQFSLDSNSDVSKDVKMAISEKGIAPGEKKHKPDVDYYLGREEEERELALRAKFTQNEELKVLLKNTQKALLLKKTKRGEPAKPDTILMYVRKQLV